MKRFNFSKTSKGTGWVDAHARMTAGGYCYNEVVDKFMRMHLCCLQYWDANEEQWMNSTITYNTAITSVWIFVDLILRVRN